ncbi:MAG: WD40 repeat domain-containing protein [Armatimonadota bacterium]
MRKLDSGWADLCWLTFSPDSASLLTYEYQNSTLSIWDVATGRHRRWFDFIGECFRPALSPDGRYLAAGSGTDKPIVQILDAKTGRLVRTCPAPAGHVDAVAFSRDGRLLAGSGVKCLFIWNVATGQLVRTFPERNVYCTALTFSPDGKNLAAIFDDDTIRVYNQTNGQLVCAITGPPTWSGDLSYTKDGTRLISSAGDGSMRLWDARSGRELAALYAFTNGDWAVVTPEGQFDTNTLDHVPGLHWVMPDALLTPVPLEIFMRQYYEPKLLTRLLHGEALPPVPSLLDVNRVQPGVTITQVTQASADTLRVTVQVQRATATYWRGGQPVTVTTGVHDLRLFRDGQLVGSWEGAIPLDTETGAARREFTVRLPHRSTLRQVMLSAYAFNDNQVKSETARTTYTLPKVLPSVKGRAYVICVGVNVYEDPRWNLHFAANDARLAQAALTNRLRKTGRYADVIGLCLLSEGINHLATREAVHTVLDLLAGHPVPAARLATVPGRDS